MSEPTGNVLLRVEDLKTHFFTDVGVARSVDGIRFEIRRGETLGVVGESGCGKSVTALSVMRLIPQPPGRIVRGRILLHGQDLVALPEKEMREIRGNRIGMIFQEPMTSLNPVYTVGDQVMEGILVHHPTTHPRDARSQTIELLRKVGIPSPEKRVDDYPHQMSGGMRQRVMIAMALSCGPELLIADEPTTALDVTIQAQILELLQELQDEMGMSILLITHDLGVVAETCDRVVVMYAGKVVEEAPVDLLFSDPGHPYTVALFRSLPEVSHGARRLPTIRGMVPSAFEFGEGCRFRDRCSYASGRCEEEPLLVQLGSGHAVACHHSDLLRRDVAGLPTAAAAGAAAGSRGAPAP